MGDTKTTAYDTWIQNALGFDIAERRKQVREQVQSGGRARSNSFTFGEQRRGSPLVPDSSDPQETAYKKRLAEVGQHVRSAQGKGATMPDGVAAKLKEAGELAGQKNHTQAIAALDEADLLVTQAEDTARRDTLKKAYDAIADTVRSNTSNGEADQPWFSAGVRPAKVLMAALSVGFSGKKTTEELAKALQDLQDMLPQIKDMGERRVAHEGYVLNFRPKVKQALAIKPGDNKALADAQEALRKADAERTTNDVLKDASLSETQRLLDSVATELKQVQILSAQRVADMTNAKGAKKSDVRSKVMGLLEEDPGMLKQLAETPEGRGVLDTLVADIGKSAKGKTDNKFVAAALEARFGSKFTGDLENSAGPRLYSVFKMVPDEHTIGNPKIAEVKRNKNYKPVSWYGVGEDEDEGVGEHHIVINAVRTGGLKGWIVDTVAGGDNPMTHGAQKYQNVKGDKKLNAFNHVTLHEIGHGVDEKEGFMNRNGSATAFGGWLEHDLEEVADLIGAETGFYSDFKAQPRALLRTYLTAALSKGFDASKLKERGQAAAKLTKQDLLGDPGVQAAEAGRLDLDEKGWKKDSIKQHKQTASKAIALKGDGKKLAQTAIDEILSDRTAEKVVGELFSLQPEPGIDWNALAKHEAIKICVAIKLSGSDKGLWIQGSNAVKYAVGGRVYQEAYSGSWVSYEPSALSQRVTNYQFRAPGEWFADAYACYFLGKLPDSHPLGRWLATQVAPN